NPVLVQSIRDALEDTAVDLAFKQHRVHGTSAIVDGPNLLDLDDTGFGIHSHLCEVNAAISHAAGLRLALRALAVTGVVVFAVAASGNFVALHTCGSLLEGKTATRLTFGKYLALAHHNFFRRRMKNRSDLLRQLHARLVSSVADGRSDRVRRGAPAGRWSLREIGIADADRDVMRTESQLLGDNLGEDGTDSATNVLHAGE